MKKTFIKSITKLLKEVDLLKEITHVMGVIIGSYTFAYAINTLYRPFGFLSTGFNGIAMILNYTLGWSISICSFIFNIIFALIGIKYVNKNFAFKSFIGITFVSIFLDVTKNSTVYVDDPIIAVIFGGLTLGMGVGIAIRSGGALGGMNILGKIVNKYFGLSIGTFDMLFNLFIVFTAGVIFDIKMAMYTIMARFVATKTLDAINEGLNRTKTVMIISNKADIIAEKLIKEIGRGVTYINTQGAYTGNNKHMIYCVVRLTQLGKLKELVKKTDKNVFMTVMDAKEVYGKGF